MVVFDSADGKDLGFYWKEPGAYYEGEGGTAVEMADFTKLGTVEVDNYAETKIGLQVMFQF